MACSKRDFGSTQKGVAIPQRPFRHFFKIKEVNSGRSPCTHFVSVPKAVCPAHLLSSAAPPCLARSQSLQLTGSENVTNTRPLSRQRALQKPHAACRSVSRGFFRPSDSRMYDCSSRATAHPTRQGRGFRLCGLEHQHRGELTTQQSVHQVSHTKEAAPARYIPLLHLCVWREVVGPTRAAWLERPLH